MVNSFESSCVVEAHSHSRRDGAEARALRAFVSCPRVPLSLLLTGCAARRSASQLRSSVSAFSRPRLGGINILARLSRTAATSRRSGRGISAGSRSRSTSSPFPDDGGGRRGFAAGNMTCPALWLLGSANMIFAKTINDWEDGWVSSGNIGLTFNTGDDVALGVGYNCSFPVSYYYDNYTASTINFANYLGHSYDSDFASVLPILFISFDQMTIPGDSIIHQQLRSTVLP